MGRGANSPACEAERDLVRHPSALYFEIAAAHPAQLRGEVGLRVYDLNNVRCGGGEGRAESSVNVSISIGKGRA